MPITGRALTIGLNAVDPGHYGGWSGELNACEADAEDMAAIAKDKQYKVKTLLTSAATLQQVTEEIEDAAATLKKGDIFLLSYSGHGGQLPDLNTDEPDAQDETWCLFDRELVDDQLFSLLTNFAPGVRILVFSDSCHSGTVTKMAFYHGMANTRSLVMIDSDEKVKFRNMPPDVALRTYRQNRALYDPILKNKKLKKSAENMKASVILISGCQDNQLSADGAFNGLFTATMLRVWNDGKFNKPYRKFHSSIVSRMPPDQTPNFFSVGPSNPTFEGQSPFQL